MIVKKISLRSYENGFTYRYQGMIGERFYLLSIGEEINKNRGF